MISLYTGTPGSGKSLDLAQQIKDKVSAGHPVICNFPVNLEELKQHRKNRTKSGQMYYYWDMSELSVDKLIEHAKLYHKVGKESQTLLVIDECAILFNSREWQTARDDRMKWIVFFQQHRKLGYDVILVAQQDRMIDKQIRGFIEYEVKHRKVNNFFRSFGGVFDKIGIKVFVAVTYWYGIKTRLESRWFFFTPKHARLYNTMQVFSKEKQEEPTTAGAPAAAMACPKGVAAAPRRQLPSWLTRSFRMETPEKKTSKIVRRGRGRSTVAYQRS